MRRALSVLAMIIVVAIAFVVIARATSKTIDGISCDMNGQASYHGTAQLTVVVANRKEYVHPPSGIGVSTLHLCRYWLHTANDSGTIAIDAPHRIVPTLGQFFDIWGQPLSLQHVWRYSASGGVTLAYVGATPHSGDLRGIKLYDGTRVTIVVGVRYTPRLDKPSSYGQ
jgi:hypothetical protein